MMQLVNNGNILYISLIGSSSVSNIAIISTLMYTYFSLDLDDRIKEIR